MTWKLGWALLLIGVILINIGCRYIGIDDVYIYIASGVWGFAIGFNNGNKREVIND